MTTTLPAPGSGSRNTLFVITILALLAQFCTAGQHGRLPSPRDGDPCGLPDTTSLAYRLAASLNWGYGYDTLRTDIARWSASPFVRVDSVGASVQKRALYLLTIQDTTAPPLPRKRVWIHARTHPNEVQGTWVTNQIIAQLLGSSQLARQLRGGCVFNILPMINPDGVELKRSRENANNIDIESNWTAVPGEPEVQTLRAMFVTLMAEPNPIRIALNMHSAYGKNRYFVYHTATGTTAAYAVIEQRFINTVRSYFPGGIRPYDYFVSWTTGPSLVYPESWFWKNCGESVLALTYEDMNDTSARAFDSTANAILRGIADELGISGSTDAPDGQDRPATFALEQNFPNPFNPVTTIRFRVPGDGFRHLSPATLDPQPATPHVRLTVYDLLGREVAVLVDEPKEPGTYSVPFSAQGLSSGMYVYRLSFGGFTQTRTMLLLR
jgi:hypothetical protein